MGFALYKALDETVETVSDLTRTPKCPTYTGVPHKYGAGAAVLNLVLNFVRRLVHESLSVFLNPYI